VFEKSGEPLQGLPCMLVVPSLTVPSLGHVLFDNENSVPISFVGRPNSPASSGVMLQEIETGVQCGVWGERGVPCSHA
jgi:hypothetical protein